jgi:sulfate adenylyltransferase (ADP) / ATP adenylyltransferase
MVLDPLFFSNPPWLQPGMLWPSIKQQTQLALECGALEPIPTNYEWVEQENMRFLVRVLANIQRKETSSQQRKPDFNPFLPYDPHLFVADLSPTHLVLLNKFNVMDHHILIVTRAFAPQDSLLNSSDFQALAIGLSEMDGLGFYNGGQIAGASQRHKHLQIVPLPFVPDGSQLPLESLMLETVGHNPKLPYRHAIAHFTPLDFTPLDFTQPLAVAEMLLTSYHQLLATLNLIGRSAATEPLGAYNLLVTREWMCVIPRSQESFVGIPVNSLGFTGALLVKNQTQLDDLRALGPLTLLTEVGFAV